MEAERRKFLLIVTASLCVCGVIVDRFIIPPLVALWKERAERIEELNARIAKGSLLLEREAMLRERWENMKQSALPNDASVAQNEILKAVDRWAQTSNLKMTSIKSQWRPIDERYTTLECQTSGAGDLHAIARFLYELERSPLPLKVEKYELSTRDENGATIALGVQFSGIRFLEKEQ